MLIRNKQLPSAILFALMLVVTAHAQQDPLETIRIDTFSASGLKVKLHCLMRLTSRWIV